MLACGSYIRFRSSIFLPLPPPAGFKSISLNVPPDENANPEPRESRDRFRAREVERRNTIAGIALPSPPPRGTIQGGGGTVEIKIGSVDVTGRRRGGPTLVSRQRPSITRRNRRQAQEACVLLAHSRRARPRPQTTVHVDDDDDDENDDDGDGRTNRRLRGKHSEYIRRAAARRSASSSRIPSTERRRARGRICVAE